METPTHHTNYYSVTGDVVFGSKLHAGDVLEETDVYASTDGRWEKCPCPGVVLMEGVAVVFVRSRPGFGPK